MAKSAPAEIRFSVGHEEAAADCVGAGCSAGELLSEPLVALIAVAISLSMLLAFAYIRDAREVCCEERERVRTEADAIGRFSDRVSTIETTEGMYTTNGATQTIAFAPPDARLERVRDAYKETVMDVPHYREEYGDTLPESMAEEFGVDVATAVCHGDSLSPQLQRTIVGRAGDAQRRRDRLEDAIGDELASIDSAESDLGAVDRERRALLDHVANRPRFEALVDVWHRLGDLEERVGSSLEARQSFLRNPPMHVREDLPPFHDYLYEPLDVSHPVLAAGAALGDRINRDRKRILEALVRSG